MTTFFALLALAFASLAGLCFIGANRYDRQYYRRTARFLDVAGATALVLTVLTACAWAAYLE